MPECPPRAHDQFGSSDPYEVLGLSPAATIADIKKKRNRLQMVYHPDVTKDSATLEISQKINAAATALINRLERQGSRPSSPPPGPPPRSEPSTSDGGRTAEREPGDEENVFFAALMAGIGRFKKYLPESAARGVTAAQIQEWLNSERAKNILRRSLANEVLISIDKQEQVVTEILEWAKLGVDRKIFIEDPELVRLVRRLTLHKLTTWGGQTADHFFSYVTAWQRIGLNLADVANLPEAQEFFKFQGVEICIKKHGEKGPAKFLEFVNRWKNAGVDLGSLVYAPEAQNWFKDRAVNICIKIYGEENPNKFLGFVEAWKRAGVDLRPLVNSKPAQDFLIFTANRKQHYQPTKFVEFVRAWMGAGWQPPQEILDKVPNT